MKIKILGSGCANCVRLEENAKQAVKELNLVAEVEHIYDIAEITAYGIMSMPALVVDEKVILSGKVANIDELKEIFNKI